MKIIISHDVDHLTVWEHKADLILPKFVVRSFIECATGYISYKELGYRFRSFVLNKWQNIAELMQFDRMNKIPATFFIGVARGKGMCYSLDKANMWIYNILHEGFDAGVHGVAYNDRRGIDEEWHAFRALANKEKYGIRLHYLRRTGETLGLLEKAGYLFDASIYAMENPYKVGDMWEFPLHLVDGRIINKGVGWQSRSLAQVKDDTKRTIGEAFDSHINYFSVLLHDRYFSDGFLTWREWYVWLVDYADTNGIEFVGYRDAIKALEKDRS